MKLYEKESPTTLSDKNQEVAIVFITKTNKKDKELGFFQISFSCIHGLCIQFIAVSVTVFCPQAPACAQNQPSRHLTQQAAEAARKEPLKHSHTIHTTKMSMNPNSSFSAALF